jgi:hypothetical protein
VYGKVEELSRESTRNVSGKSLERIQREDLVALSPEHARERNVNFVVANVTSRDQKSLKDKSSNAIGQNTESSDKERDVVLPSKNAKILDAKSSTRNALMLVKLFPRENSRNAPSRHTRVENVVNVAVSSDIVMDTLARTFTRNANLLEKQSNSKRSVHANGHQRRIPNKEDVVVSLENALERNAKLLEDLAVGLELSSLLV